MHISHIIINNIIIIQRIPLFYDSNMIIDQTHKSHSSPVPHPIIYHLKHRCAHFCLNNALWNMEQVWDLLIWTIGTQRPHGAVITSL